MRRAAVLAEELGYADVWVSDHLVVPTGAAYPPSAYIYEPISALAWVADGAVRPVVSARYPLDRVGDAMRAKWESRHVGSVVVTPP